MSLIAVVTGGNKGIGYHIVKDLARDKRIKKVIYSFRKEKDGKKSLSDLIRLEKIDKEKLDNFPLDLMDEKSMDRFCQYVKEKYLESENLSILINNAGIAVKKDGKWEADVSERSAMITLETNFFGTIKFTEKMLQIIDKKKGKIIHVSSWGGLQRGIKKELRDTFANADTMEALNKAARQWIQDVKDGSWEEKGYDTSYKFPSYGISKLCLNSATRLQAEKHKDGLMIVSCHPGFTKTDMTKHSDYAQPTEKGSDTPVYLALEETRKEYHGSFVTEKTRILKTT